MIKKRYTSTKIIDGFSTVFRQEKALPIHCGLLHGYSIAFKVQFESETLDDRNWVIDFGFLNRSSYRVKINGQELSIGQWFKYMFDHTVIVAKDDTQLKTFEEASKLGTLELRVVDAVGCERFAELVYIQLKDFLVQTGESKRVRVKSVECIENSKNSAIYEEEYTPTSDLVSLYDFEGSPAGIERGGEVYNLAKDVGVEIGSQPTHSSKPEKRVARTYPRAFLVDIYTLKGWDWKKIENE